MPSFELSCPVDASPMDKVPVSGFTIDRCSACRALWFDAVELQRVLASKTAASSIDAPGHHSDPALKSDAALTCPRCQSPLVAMVDQHQPHVHMRGCTVCGGLLLARGALLDLSEFTLKERLAAFFTLRDPPKV